MTFRQIKICASPAPCMCRPGIPQARSKRRHTLEYLSSVKHEQGKSGIGRDSIDRKLHSVKPIVRLYGNSACSAGFIT